MELDELRSALDAATPSVEIERARDAVGQRVRRIRTRRRLASGATLLVLLAVLLGGVMAATRNDGASKIVIGGGGTTVPNGSSVLLTKTPTNIAFVSARRGYGVFSTCTSVQHSPVCDISVGVTDDAGSSWYLAGSIHSVKYDGWSGYPFIMLAASGDHVWVYGNRTFFSRDGGRTFVEQHLGGIVNSLVPMGGTAWSVVRDCAPSETCATSVASVPLDGGAWAALAPLPGLTYPYAILRRPTASIGYVMTTDASAFFRTDDGGHTWQHESLPARGGAASFATVGAQQVWLVVGDANATTAQDKALYRSDDGGAHWTTVASAFGIAPQSAQFHERGDVFDVEVPTPDHIFVASNPSAVSFDGGRTWRGIGSIVVDDFSFVDADHGWAASPSAIYRTLDGGGRWELAHGRTAEAHPVTPSKAQAVPTTTAPSHPVYALVHGADGFLVPQGWTGGGAKNFGGPASYATYRAPNRDGSIDYETSGGEFAAIYNADNTPTLAHALELVRSCSVTSHTSVSTSRMTFTCASTNGHLVAGVVQIAPYPGGWKTATVALPAGSDPAEMTAILDSIR